MAEVTLAIVAHAVLGVVLAAGAWGSGLAFTRPGREPFAYAFGLLVLVAAAAPVLVSPWFAPLSLALVALTLARGGRRLPLRPVARASLPAIGLGTALGLVNHGPTEEVDSSAYGDMLFYAAKVVSAGQSIFPFRDLLVEGERHVYVESGWMLMGGALEPVAGVDPILLQAATAPAFFLTALALGFALLRRPEPRDAALVALLAAGAVAYPTWLTESPPVALAAPLAFALYGIWRQTLPLSFLLALGAAVATGFFLTKALGLLPLAVVGGVAIVRDHRRAAAWLFSAAAVSALGTIALFAADSVWLAEVLEPKFLPVDAARGLRRQIDVRDTQAAATSVLIVGEVLLAILLARRRAWTPLGVLGAAAAGGWLVGGHGFDIVLGLAVLLAACFLVERGVTEPRLLLAAGLSLATAAWFRDISGVGSTLLPLALVAAGVLVVLAPRPGRFALAAASTAVVIGAVAFPTERRTTLTTDDREAWARAHELVPEDALIFTSETGPLVTGDQGWNYYPGIWGRQLYIAGWSNSPLLVDDAARARRLASNQRVLSGRVVPRELDLDHDYSAFYAVVEADDPVPSSFERRFANERLAIYELP